MCDAGSMGRVGIRGLGMGGRGVTGILSGYLVGDNLACSIRGNIVTVGRVRRGRSTIPRRGAALANAMLSRAKRPVVKTGVLIGNAAGKAAASLSKRFSLSMSHVPTALVVSCVNCNGRRVGTATKGVLGMIVTPSGGIVRRIIIANCNAFGGSTCTNSTSAIGTSGVGSVPTISFGSLLRNGTPKMRFDSSSNRPKTSSSLGVHNVKSFGTDGSPLCMVSKVPVHSNSVGAVDSSTNLSVVSAVGDSSVRGVAVVGSTTTTSLCNSHTTGNMMLVAAGGNGDKGPRVSFGTS